MVPKKPWSKWTADTERAFLSALRLTGQVSKAAAEIGRSRSAARTRRRTNPEFARAWDETIAAQQAEWIAATQARLGPGIDSPEDGAGGGRLTPWCDRSGGWNARKRGRFLRTLRRTKLVGEACRAAGMSPSAAYYLRSQSPRFAAAWAKALRDDAPSLADVAYERAVHGWVEPVTVDGRQVGERRRYSETLLRELLRIEAMREARRERAEIETMRRGSGSPTQLERRAIEAAQAAGGYFARRTSEAELNEVLIRKLELLDRRLEAGEMDEEDMDWEEMDRDAVDGVQGETADRRPSVRGL